MGSSQITIKHMFNCGAMVTLGHAKHIGQELLHIGVRSPLLWWGVLGLHHCAVSVMTAPASEMRGRYVKRLLFLLLDSYNGCDQNARMSRTTL